LEIEMTPAKTSAKIPTKTTSSLKATSRKAFVAGLAALTMASGMIAAAPSAQAKDGRNAALIGGLAAGALVGGAIAQGTRSPAYGAPAYGYDNAPAYGYDNAPVYQGRTYYPAQRGGYPAGGGYYPAAGGYYEEPEYVQQCFRERRPVMDRWGNVVGFRRVQVCR